MDAGIKPHRVGLMQICGSYEQLFQGRIIHEAGEAEASGPGPR